MILGSQKNDLFRLNYFHASLNVKNYFFLELQ